MGYTGPDICKNKDLLHFFKIAIRGPYPGPPPSPVPFILRAPRQVYNTYAGCVSLELIQSGVSRAPDSSGSLPL
jgi:hypothetical protein